MVFLLLSACAPSLESFDDHGGVIRHTQLGSNMAGVMAMANSYCSKLGGKHARITSEELVVSDTVAFDCAP